MPSAATVTSLIAIAACLTGAAVALGMWQQRRRAVRARRMRHPASPPPVAIVIDEPSRRWRLEVPADAPPTAVDIVSWRVAASSARSSARSSAPWTSEPIVEPLEIGPGGWALTTSEPPPAATYDVVLAWTSHSDAGELQGSRTFRVDGRPRPRGLTPPAAPSRSPLRWPLIEIALAAVLAAALVLVVVLWWSTDDSPTDAVPGTTRAVDATTVPSVTSAPLASATTAPAIAATTGSPSATSAAPSTTAAAGTTPPTAPTATTTRATTTRATTSSTTSTTEPRPTVEIVASIDACGAGPNCLVASFTIDGFDASPTTYVCEFADGERISFGFGGDSVVRACATGSTDASITIEIEGVRSETITRDDAG